MLNHQPSQRGPEGASHYRDLAQPSLILTSGVPESPNKLQAMPVVPQEFGTGDNPGAGSCRRIGR